MRRNTPEFYNQLAETTIAVVTRFRPTEQPYCPPSTLPTQVIAGDTVYDYDPYTGEIEQYSAIYEPSDD